MQSSANSTEESENEGSRLLDLTEQSIPLTDRLKIVRGMVRGRSATVSEAHISYLLREWEINLLQFKESTSVTIRPIEVEFQPNDKPWRSACYELHRYWPGWLGVVAALSFIATFCFCNQWEMERIDLAIISMLLSHAILYVVILASSGLSLYRSWSVHDGFNTITRFTVKLSMGSHGEKERFPDSNMPCSISSSVSTRGSTLNKLMNGMSYSLGFGLFIKFVQVRSTVWTLIAAFGYLLIILTGLYENRFFDLDTAQAIGATEGITHHRKPALRNEPAMRGPDQARTSPTFDYFHMIGVIGFVVISTIGLTGHYLSALDREKDVLESQHVAVRWSWIGSGFALVFAWMNKVLTSQRGCPCYGFEWMVDARSKRVNIARGLICILIEFVGLVSCALAGVIFQV